MDAPASLTGPHSGPAALHARRRALATLVVVAIAAFAAGFAIPSAWCATLTRQGTYPVLALTSAWLGLLLVRKLRRSNAKCDWRRCLWPGVLLVAGSILVATGERHSAKVLYDEYVLGATALHMHECREVATRSLAWPIEGRMVGVSDYLDKRPGFFPFLVATLHDLTGYRADNAILLNLLLIPVVLWCTYRVGCEVTGSRSAGALAVVLLLGLPLLVTTACSGGMDFLNLTLVALGTLLGLHWVQSGDEDDLALFALGGVLLIHTRYESGLYAVAIASTVIAGWAAHRRLAIPAALLATPILLLPVAWLQRYVAVNPELWELREGLTNRFSLSYLQTNLPAAWRYFTAWSPGQTNSVWLALVGTAAAAIALARAGRLARTLGWKAVPVVAFGACAFGNLLLLQVYYWGALDDWIVARLSLPFWWFLAVLTSMVAASAWGTSSARVTGSLLAASVAAYMIFSFPILAQRRTDHRNWLDEIARWEMEIVGTAEPERTLLVTNKSPLFHVVRRRASISMERARLRIDQMAWHFEQGSFPNIFVFQHLEALPGGGHRLAHGDDLGPRVLLQTVAEKRFATTLARVSRVVGILPDVPASAAAQEPLSDPSTPPPEPAR